MASLKKRGEHYYLQWCVAGKVRRRGLNTTSYQAAREKQRQFESAMARGTENPLPTRTPIAVVVADYLEHMRTTTSGERPI
jgi:hypothetical protein